MLHAHMHAQKGKMNTTTRGFHRAERCGSEDGVLLLFFSIAHIAEYVKVICLSKGAWGHTSIPVQYTEENAHVRLMKLSLCSSLVVAVVVFVSILKVTYFY